MKKNVKVRYALTKLEYNSMYDTLKNYVLEVFDTEEECKKSVEDYALFYREKNDIWEEENKYPILRFENILNDVDFIEFEIHCVFSIV